LAAPLFLVFSFLSNKTQHNISSNGQAQMISSNINTAAATQQQKQQTSPMSSSISNEQHQQ
jgi:hypothetical protein